MVSWGTTANVSVPVQERPVPSPAGAVVTRGADGGWLLEGGLSAAGSFLAWLGRLLDKTPDQLARMAGGEPAGRTRRAGGALARRGPRPVVARRRPRGLHGAGRGPRAERPGPRGDGGRGVGRAARHGGGDGRAARRIVGGRGDPRRRRDGLARSGSRCSPRCSACRRRGARSGEAASAGAALLAGKALGMGLVARRARPGVRGDRARRRARSRSTAACGPRSTTSRCPSWRRRRRCRAQNERRSETAVRVDLAYGRHGTSVEVPDSADVILPVDAPAPRRRGRRPSAPRWRAPLGGPVAAALAEGARRVAVVFPDLTRPMPNRTVLPPLLDELARAGVPDERVTLLCATGTHRQATAAEMAELIGPELVARYRVVDHDAESDEHVRVGEVDGVAVLLQREYVEADVRIVTRVRRAALLRRVQRRAQGGVPGLGRHRDDPRGPPSAPDRRRAGHLPHPARQSGARLRAGGGGAGSAAAVARRRHQPGPPRHGGVRRAAGGGARRRLRARRCGGAARGGRALRPRRLDQRGPSARPQPVPGREGHGGGGPGAA